MYAEKTRRKIDCEVTDKTLKVLILFVKIAVLEKY